VSSAPFVSYAQNGEDVVLFRALGSITEGRYVDVGANDPIADSVTYAFYQRGWSGITIDPMHHYAERQRAERPRDLMVEAAISDDASGSVTLHQIDDTGLSTLVDDIGDEHRAAGWAVDDVVVPASRLDDVLATAGWDGQEIHFMLIDTEGAERAVLETIDLDRWRPWVMVVEATRPLSSEPTHSSWEPLLLAADYEFCLFDGLSRFYVAKEHSAELKNVLSAPANILDRYIKHQSELRENEIARLAQATTDLNSALQGLTAERAALIAERDRIEEQARERDRENTQAIMQWRTAALRRWVSTIHANRSREIEELHQQIASHINHIKVTEEELLRRGREIDAIHQTLSWRVTKPLRWVRGLSARTGS
jgi:FkbM family methyltransferase